MDNVNKHSSNWTTQHTQRILHERSALRVAKRHTYCHELAELRDALNRWKFWLQNVQSCLVQFRILHRLADKPSRPTSKVLSANGLVNLHICIGLNDFCWVKISNYIKRCAWYDARIFSAGQKLPLPTVQIKAWLSY
jgi:hypothetical protein